MCDLGIEQTFYRPYMKKRNDDPVADFANTVLARFIRVGTMALFAGLMGAVPLPIFDITSKWLCGFAVVCALVAAWYTYKDYCKMIG